MMDTAARGASRIDPMIVAVNALGITQLTAWGTGFFCLGVLAKPVVAETGRAMATVFLGLSVATDLTIGSATDAGMPALRTEDHMACATRPRP